MSETLTLNSHKFYLDAKKALQRKDMLDFYAKISLAIELSQNDKKMLAKTTYLRAKGLMDFYQHTKALEGIAEALENNTGDELFELNMIAGKAKGYLGFTKSAIGIFQDQLSEVDTEVKLVRVCINLAWAYLTLDKESSLEIRLEEAKKYLDIGQKHFDLVSNDQKRKLCNNYGVYYYYTEEYEKAIEIINGSFQYSEEKDFPKLYNNLAEIYLKSDKHAVRPEVYKCTTKAELIATKYDDKLEMGKTFFTQAMAELQEDQFFTALDTLYLAFEHFKEAQAISYAFNCMMKINELVNEYKTECMQKLQKRIQTGLKDTPYQDYI